MNLLKIVTLTLTLTAGVSASANSPLTSLEGVQLQLLDAKILSNCIASEPELCKSTTAVRIEADVQQEFTASVKYHEEYIKLLAQYEEKRVAFIASINPENTIQNGFTGTEELDQEYKSVKARASIAKALYSYWDHSRILFQFDSRFGELKIGDIPAAGVSISSTHRAQLRDHGTVRLYHAPSYGMKILFAADRATSKGGGKIGFKNTETMMATCSSAEVEKYVFFKETHITCQFPNNRGYMLFRVL